VEASFRIPVRRSGFGSIGIRLDVCSYGNGINKVVMVGHVPLSRSHEKFKSFVAEKILWRVVSEFQTYSSKSRSKSNHSLKIDNLVDFSK
jgi:hypothetical protein